MFGVQGGDERVDGTRRERGCGEDRGEEEMGRVGLPVQPVELSEGGNPAADVNAGMQIMLWGEIGWQVEFTARDLGECSFDHGELGCD